MSGAFTPEYLQQLRHLFEEAVTLVPDKREAVLQGAEDEALRRHVEALLVADGYADVILNELRVSVMDQLLASRWERILILFDRAKTLQPSDQSRFLGQISGGQEAVRADLESMLAAYEADLDAFKAPLSEAEMPAAPEAAPAPVVPAETTGQSQSKQRRTDALAGTTISHYEIIERLGQGGMGVVYKARDTSLDRLVAMKFLPPYLSADDEAETRFLHEARAASALEHPNIGVIHAINRDETGQLYIVMAYYDGDSLGEKLSYGPLSVPVALDYAIQVAKGLQRAHEEGIIHRDIKPGNVMVTKRGQVRIVDFGLAKMQNVNLTQAGVSMGTVAYMSPEQARGGELDHRADLWALGVVLYEMLTGERPFEGTYEAAILYAAAHQQHTGVQVLRPEVPEKLAAMLDRLLKKNLDERYQSAEELLEDLEAIRLMLSQSAISGLASTPSAAVAPHVIEPASVQPTPASAVTPASAAAPVALPPEPPTVIQPAPVPAPARSRKGLFLGLGAVAVLALVLFSFWMFNKGGSSGDNDTTRPNREMAQAQVARSMDFFRNGQYNLAQTELETALKYDDAYSEAWSVLAAVNIRLGNFEEAVINSRKAIELEPSNSLAFYNLAFALEETGAFTEAIEAYSESVRIEPGFTQAYSALGNLLIQQGRPEEALRILGQGQTADPESNYLYLIYKNQGKAHLALNQPDQALPLLAQSLLLKPDWPETVSLLAQSYEASGQADKAREHWERYLDLETDPAKRQTALRQLRQE